MVSDERRLKVHEVTDKIGISKSAITPMLTDNFDLNKLSVITYSDIGLQSLNETTRVTLSLARKFEIW